MTVRQGITPATPVPVDSTRSLADLRPAEGLGRGTAVLIADGSIQAVPMRMPPGAWALLVTAADRQTTHGEIVLFAGEWREHEYPASGCEGDLILRLAPPVTANAAEDTVAVQLAIAAYGEWIPAGTWPSLGHDWPAVVAPAAAAIMGTYIAAAEAEPPMPRSMRVVGNRVVRRIGLLDLLDAGLLVEGEELLYRRPSLGVHRSGQVVGQGMLQLDDGRTCTSLSAANAALGSPHQSGWKTWFRARDGRPMFELRDDYKSTMDGRHGVG
ncbi:hypothetical protein [Amycolatopsis sp. NPDC058986]|uniref:restriction system modified-DNA reader domain-containing protein n=1 Tax=unclassified Amycolatopsis TaxID=2618356 RepID=UPI00366F3D19